MNFKFICAFLALQTQLAFASTTLFDSSIQCQPRFDGVFNRCVIKDTDISLDSVTIPDTNISRYISFESKIALSIACTLQTPSVLVNGVIVHPGGSSTSDLKYFSMLRTPTQTTAKVRVEPRSLADVVKPGCMISVENEVSLPVLTLIEEAITKSASDLDMTELALTALDIASTSDASKAVLRLAKASLESSLPTFQSQKSQLEASFASELDLDKRSLIEIQISDIGITIDSLSRSIDDVAACESGATCTFDFSASRASLDAKKVEAISTLKSIKAFLVAEDARLIGVEEDIRAKIKSLLSKKEFQEVASQ
jgi:hypothetical protein